MYECYLYDVAVITDLVLSAGKRSDPALVSPASSIS